MGWHNILSKTDRAIVAYIVANGVGTDLDCYPAKRDSGKVLPNITIDSESFIEDPPQSRSFLIKVSVNVRTPGFLDSGDDPAPVEQDSERYVQNCFDLFYPVEDQDGSVLAGLITSAARNTLTPDLQNFECSSAIAKDGSRGQREKDFAWVDILNLECLCTANALT